MRSKSGWRPSFEIALGLVKSPNKQGLFVSQIKDDGNGSVSGCLDHGNSHFRRCLVEIMLGVRQAFVIKEILQRPTIATKIAGVDEEIRAGKGGLLQDHGF